MKFQDPVYHEVFNLWNAWQTIVETVMPRGTISRDVPPLTVYKTVAGMSVDRIGRLTHLMVAEGHADDVSEAAEIIVSLLAYAEAGRRPRFGVEAGLTLDEFLDHRP